MQGSQQCPHCDHRHIKQMTDRPHEAESGVTWYQCLKCERLWFRPKPGMVKFGRAQPTSGPSASVFPG
jgi:hypothetical protein